MRMKTTSKNLWGKIKKKKHSVKYRPKSLYLQFIWLTEYALLVYKFSLCGLCLAYLYIQFVWPMPC